MPLFFNTKLGGFFVEKIEVELKLLIEALNKKASLTTEIYNITENQHTIIKSEALEKDAFDFMFKETVKEKQIRLDELVSVDTAFQKIYEGVASELTQNKEKYRYSIKTLQQKIKEITDTEIKLKVLEERNKTEMNRSHTIKKIVIPKNTAQYASNQYNIQKNIKKK